MTQKDNTTFRHKVALRRQALALLENPIILETHGGVGKLYRALYAGMAGMVFEKDERKAEILAGQRPTWAVYHADCVMALQAGAGSWLPINFVDCDPYGAPWTTLHALSCGMSMDAGTRSDSGGLCAESLRGILLWSC